MAVQGSIAQGFVYSADQRFNSVYLQTASNHAGKNRRPVIEYFDLEIGWFCGQEKINSG